MNCGWFKRLVVGLVMLALQASSFAQAVGPLWRGSHGAPLTGFTRNGTFVQGGQVVGNPHQLLHQLQNASLWTTAAVALSSSTDPSFVQMTVDQMMAAIAPTGSYAPGGADPQGQYLARLYLSVNNPYVAGQGPVSAPPATMPETGATPPAGPAIDNHQQYALALAYAQGRASGGASGTEPVGGWLSSTDAQYVGKSHEDSSDSLKWRGFNEFIGKAVFQGAQDPLGGATAFFLLQGQEARLHLSHLQGLWGASLGSPILFTQQNLVLGRTGGGGCGHWDSGPCADPWDTFIASVGAPAAGHLDWQGAGQAPFALGYIRPDGQAHEFEGGISNLHFRQGDLGQGLRQGAQQHWRGQQAAAGVDFSGFESDRALFLQGVKIFGYTARADHWLLHGLMDGRIAPGHPDYERARALAEQGFRSAYAAQVEYGFAPKFTKEGALYQAQRADLSGLSDQALFAQGLNLFDRRADARQEQLLRDLRDGRLVVGSEQHRQARELAEARYRVALQKALEPPKKANFFKQLVGVVVAAVVTYFTAGAASVWAAGLTGASTTTVAGVTTVVTSSTAGVAATAIGSAVGAYAGAVVGAGIQTGSLSQALAAGENALKGGVASIVVNTAMAAAGVSAGNLGGTLGVSQATGEALYNGITQGLSQSIAHGGSLGQALLDNVLNAGVDLIAADVASVIGAQTEPGTLGKYAAHAALGCGVGAARSGSGDGCAPAAVGAVTGHLAADGIQVALQDDRGALAQIFNSVPGRTLQDHTIFVGSIVGGTSAALATGGKNVQGDFALGQGAAENAIENNYLKFDERKKLEQAEKDCYAGGGDQACATVTALRQKDQLTDKLLANAAASCKGAECADVATFIRKEMSDLGCPTLAACPDQKALAAYWSAAQGKAQGLEMVVPEAWLLDVKAATDLAKWGIKAVAASAGKDSLQALQAISRTTADDAALARVSNNFYREGAPVDLGKSVVQTNPNEAVFWSGRTDGVGRISAAKEIADHFRGKTLEQLIESRQIGMPFYDPVNAKSVQAWIDISTELAKNASGEVRAVLGSSMRPQSIWETYELPALLKNPAVTRIIRVDPKTKKEIVIFERK